MPMRGGCWAPSCFPPSPATSSVAPACSRCSPTHRSRKRSELAARPTRASIAPVSYRPFLRPGEPAPWFRAPAIGGSRSYNFHTVAGRHVLMLFLGSAAGAEAAAALALVAQHRALFDDERAAFFGITSDPADAA